MTQENKTGLSFDNMVSKNEREKILTEERLKSEAKHIRKKNLSYVLKSMGVILGSLVLVTVLVTNLKIMVDKENKEVETTTNVESSFENDYLVKRLIDDVDRIKGKYDYNLAMSKDTKYLLILSKTDKVGKIATVNETDPNNTNNQYHIVNVTINDKLYPQYKDKFLNTINNKDLMYKEVDYQKLKDDLYKVRQDYIFDTVKNGIID